LASRREPPRNVAIRQHQRRSGPAPKPARRPVRNTKLEAASRRADRRWRELRVAAPPRVRTPPTLLYAPARRRAIEIRGAACLSGVIRISGLVRRLWIGSRSISFLAAIIAEGVPARHPAVGHMARTDARPTAAVGWDRATRATSALRIRRDLSVRKGSARKPQRLPRRRFMRRSPLNVTRAMEPRSPLAVRRFLPILLRDDWFTTKQTGGERIGDEAIANPGVDPLALVADSGRLRFWQRRGMLGASGATGTGSGAMAS
jgi:hypothetical protein